MCVGGESGQRVGQPPPPPPPPPSRGERRPDAPCYPKKGRGSFRGVHHHSSSFFIVLQIF